MPDILVHPLNVRLNIFRILKIRRARLAQLQQQAEAGGGAGPDQNERQ